jgi:hypothetical protein
LSEVSGFIGDKTGRASGWTKDARNCSFRCSARHSLQDRWRKVATLSRVIGADEETAKRLLIEVGARVSEKDDGLWGLIKSHPFDQVNR